LLYLSYILLYLFYMCACTRKERFCWTQIWK